MQLRAAMLQVMSSKKTSPTTFFTLSVYSHVGRVGVINKKLPIGGDSDGPIKNWRGIVKRKQNRLPRLSHPAAFCVSMVSCYEADPTLLFCVMTEPARDFSQPRRYCAFVGGVGPVFLFLICLSSQKSQFSTLFGVMTVTARCLCHLLLVVV